MKIELCEHPREFIVLVHQMVKRLERVKRLVDLKGVDTVILSNVTVQYNAEIQVSESVSDWLTRK